MGRMIPVLLVEDQPAVARALEVVLGLGGVAVRTATSPAEALEILAQEPIGVVVQDMNFTPGATSGEEGIELFRELRRREPSLPVVLLTAWTSLEAAVALTREGAADYLAKPWNDEVLVARVRHLLEARRADLDGGGGHERQLLAQRHDLGGLVWASPEMGRVVDLALRAAVTERPVLITGPSGAGKERIAELIHRNSPRKTRPLVRVNVAALPENLLEAELFGVEPGAYTGAVRRVGRFEAADGGTLLLDEIGSLSLPGQAKLLRALESGQIERLGSSAPRSIDVRVIAATNEHLEREVGEGRFRADLFWRLAVIRVEVPPLADRPADVMALADHFLAATEASASGHRWTLGVDARAALGAHDWPGNVRELDHVLRQATLRARQSELCAADLGLASIATAASAAGSGASDPGRREVERALRAAGGVVSQAAANLGISRQALYRRMERYGLHVERLVRR